MEVALFAVIEQDLSNPQAWRDLAAWYRERDRPKSLVCEAIAKGDCWSFGGAYCESPIASLLAGRDARVFLGLDLTTDAQTAIHSFAVSCGLNALRFAERNGVQSGDLCYQALTIKSRWIDGLATHEFLASARSAVEEYCAGIKLLHHHSENKERAWNCLHNPPNTKYEDLEMSPTLEESQRLSRLLLAVSTIAAAMGTDLLRTAEKTLVSFQQLVGAGSRAKELRNLESLLLRALVLRSQWEATSSPLRESISKEYHATPVGPRLMIAKATIIRRCRDAKE